MVQAAARIDSEPNYQYHPVVAVPQTVKETDWLAVGEQPPALPVLSRRRWVPDKEQLTTVGREN